MARLTRNLRDVKEYLAVRLPSKRQPDWLEEMVAETLFWSPEFRLLEEADIQPGLEVVIVHFHEGGTNRQTSAEHQGDVCHLDDGPLVRAGGRWFLTYNDHLNYGCFGPLRELLLLEEEWPEWFVEMPPCVILVKKADERPLLEQLAELRGFRTGQLVVWSECIEQSMKRNWGEGPFTVVAVEQVPTNCTCEAKEDSLLEPIHHEMCGVHRLKHAGHPQWVTCRHPNGEERVFSGVLLAPLS